MNRTLKSFPPVAMLYSALALFSTPLVRADGDMVEVQSVQFRSYPRRTADLAKWLQKAIVPGRTQPAIIFAIFGTRYRHPCALSDRQDQVRYCDSIFVYDLDDLGIHDHPPDYVLEFQFDSRSGALLRAAVEEEERQTGFNINTETTAEP